MADPQASLRPAWRVSNGMTREAPTNSAAFIWSIAEILRGDFKQSEYQKVILPLTVLRRLDAVLTSRKPEFLDKARTVEGMDGAENALRSFAQRIYGHRFYNTSPLDFRKLTDDAENVAGNLRGYIARFSPDVRDVMLRFNFDPIIDRLDRAGLLYQVIGKFADADLHPGKIDNTEMGYLYEELIRRFSELSNETAGEHFTPREVALDSYIASRGYDDIRTLVAFSGKVIDGGDEYTESGMNAFPERQTAEKFDTGEYQVMIVAEKFQTGFDQPLLHTMYVDKTLTGLNAVQTLSRLNRTHPGKNECFVLDFRNDAEQITKAFASYYEHAYAAPTDPNLMYDARTELDRHDVIRPDEMESFALAFAASNAQTHELTEAALNPAVDRFEGLDEADQEDFKANLETFVRVYSFLSQVVTFTDLGLEKLYVYGRALRLKLRDDRGGRLDISDKVELTHLRTDLTWEGDAGVEEAVHEQTQFWDGRPMSEQAQEALSVIVREMNDKHGTELTEAHKLTLRQYDMVFTNNPMMVEAAVANDDYEAFKKVAFAPVFLDTIINQMDANEEIFKLILADDRMRGLFVEFIGRSVYDQIRAG